jgi:hypothetical protein
MYTSKNEMYRESVTDGGTTTAVTKPSTKSSGVSSSFYTDKMSGFTLITSGVPQTRRTGLLAANTAPSNIFSQPGVFPPSLMDLPSTLTRQGPLPSRTSPSSALPNVSSGSNPTNAAAETQARVDQSSGCSSISGSARERFRSALPPLPDTGHHACHSFLRALLNP